MRVKKTKESLSNVTIKKKAKRLLAVTLVVLMMNPFTGYGISANAQEQEISTSVEIPSGEIGAAILSRNEVDDSNISGNEVDDSSISGNDVEEIQENISSMDVEQVEIEENIQWVFNQSESIDSVEITVKAEKDVFPEGAVLHAKKVIDTEEKDKIQNAVNEEVQLIDNTKTVTKLMSFDITITDVDGYELQPDTSKGEVRVSFAQLPMTTEDINQAQELQVFHMNDGLNEANGLDTTVDEAADTVEVKAEHFSVYTVAELTEEIRANVEAEIKTTDGTVTYYDTIEEALAAAEGMENSTVTLMKDVTTENKVTINSGSFTINLNDKTWTYNKKSGYWMLQIMSSGEITITNGNITGGALVQYGGTIIIENVTFSTSGFEALHIAGGKLVFNSGEVKVTNNDLGVWALNCNVQVNGGSFQGARRADIWLTQGGALEGNGGEIGILEVNSSGNATLNGGSYGKVNDIRYNAGHLLGKGYAYRYVSEGMPWVQNSAVKELTGVTVEKVPVKITEEPKDADVTYGYSSPHTLNVTAQKTDNATGEVTYQWYMEDGTSIPDETSTSYDIPTGLDAGEYNYYCAVSCDGYVVNTKNVEFTVDKAIPTISLEVIVYEDDPFVYNNLMYFTTTVVGINGEYPSGTLNIMDGNDMLFTDVYYSTYSQFFQQGSDDVPAGNHSFTAVFNPSTEGTGKNYASVTSAVVEQGIAKADQNAFSITEVTGKRYGDASFTLSTTGGSGTGEVTYSVPENNGILTISGDTATIVGAGTVTITAVKDSDTNYNSATATYDITVGKAPVPTIIFPTAGGIMYGQKMSECPLIGGSTEYGSFAWEDGDLIPVVNGGTNYNNVRFTPSADTIKNYETISNMYRRLTLGFGVTQATPTISLSKAVYGDSGNRTAYITVRVNPVGDGNYPCGTLKFIDCTSGSDIDITGATSVTMAGSETSYVWKGLEDKVYKVKVVYSGDDQYNGVMSEVFEIDTRKDNQSPLKIENTSSKTYGDSDFTLSTTGGSGTGAISYTSSDPTIVSVSGATATIHKAGTVSITATKEEDETFNDISVSTTLTVNKKILNINADSKINVIKGSAMPNLTYTVMGLVGNDTYTNPTITTSATTTDILGEYDILISNGTLTNDENYVVKYTNAKLTIVKAVYYVTVTGGTGAGYFSEGQTVSIKAENRNDYTFTGWSSSDGVTLVDSTAGTTTFIMPGKAVTVTANYSKNNNGTSDGANEESTAKDINSNKTNANPAQTSIIEGTAQENGIKQISGENSPVVTSQQTENTTQSEEPLPYIAGEKGKSGWNSILTAIDETSNAVNQEPVTMTVEMNTVTKIPANVIEKIRGKDVNLVLDMGDGVTWTINGKDVSDDQLFDIDLGITMNTSAIPEELIDSIRGNNDSIQIELAHNGAFGFDATLSIMFDEGNVGKFANLFYYNVETGKLEFMESAKVEEDGKARMTFVHASEYTIVLSNEAMDESTVVSVTDTDNMTDDSVKEVTNKAQAVEKKSESMLVIWILLGIILIIEIGATIIFVRRRGRRKEDEV